MRIRINDPRATRELLNALQAADCLAECTSEDELEVDVPWIEGDGDERQAHMELSFFVKAWEAQRPGLVTVVTP